VTKITELKDRINIKTGNFVLLSFATAGLYPLFWIWENSKHIDEVTETKTIDNVYLLWLIACYGWSTVLYVEDIKELLFLSGVFSLVSGVLCVVWAFRVRRALQNYALNEYGIYLQMNRFYTVFLNLYYINYCINDLPEVLRKQQVFTDMETSRASKELEKDEA